jgi:energy-coupling factor transporter ATP-binding protein EcfA2
MNQNNNTNDIDEYFKSKLINSELKKNNPTLYSVLAISAFDMANKKYPELSKLIYNVAKEKIESDINKRSNIIHHHKKYRGCMIMERIYRKNQTELSNWSDAVLNHIIKSSNIKNIYYNGSILIPSNNVFHGNMEYEDTHHDNDDDDDEEDEIEIYPKIYFKLFSVKFNNDELSKIKFIIYSYDKNITEIQEYVRECQRNYSIQLQEQMGDNLYYFEQFNDIANDRIQNRTPSTNLIFEKNRFITNRNLDNVFFEDKNTLVTRINLFKNNKEWYDQRGIPYTLGIMLYGEPGCGKTSTIKAIAKVLDRHIINIQFSHIKTSTQLKKLFYDEKLFIIERESDVNVKNTTIHVPIDKRLYVIEDIDAMGDLVHKRTENFNIEIENNEDSSFMENNNSQLLQNNINDNSFMNNPNDDIFNRSKNKDPITLATLLNILDGTLEIPGRVLIFTTNHPEQIDPALIRPGRIDMIFQYKKANKDVINQMFKSFYRIEIDDNDLNMIPEYYWTPAEINSIMFRNFFNPEIAVNELKNSKRIEFN